ncbi:MAG: hypothetical protein BWZ07_03318 [Alphaproteobacteria bacterium ADurb.BinA280]|nr:MAG: hypothetical protein BWZ07_03318 [Alphaproteobacteria bacterium ADurb.BinA280]
MGRHVPNDVDGDVAGLVAATDELVIFRFKVRHVDVGASAADAGNALCLADLGHFRCASDEIQCSVDALGCSGHVSGSLRVFRHKKTRLRGLLYRLTTVVSSGCQAQSAG